MEVQSGGLRAFSAAYRAWHDPADLAAARAIQRYLRDFLLQPGGAFACSQDADLHAGEHSGEFFALDDAHRRALGVPHVDTHRYARENGWAALGLAELYAAGGDAEALAEAVGAARWALSERILDDGAFRHGDGDAPACLADTLAMAEGLTALWRVTGADAWRTRAERALLAVPARFGAGIGYATSQTATAGIAPRPHREENIRLARLANELWRAGRDERLHAIATHAASYVFAEGVAERRPLAGALLLDRELRAPH
jgi:uncharacterized protein YyaL (SSP411 family)